MYGLFYWRTRKNRNLFIFQGLTWTSNEIAKVSFNWAKQYELSLLGVQHTSHLTDSHVALEGTWVNLSIDGAMARENGNASTSGVLRDQYGNWILGFRHYLGRCTAFEAELWGILDGLLILLNKGITRAIIQTYNLEVVRVL
ncbi:hypothetical protein Goari_005524 [Gossypium aridum]|uniref:RNase H type-1 domain-containing protein n=1 Tax=Gossypium aridum TaxID=34290 RepID=A0A7J8YPK3_GOSAI|nr:hypothetical protein [Gossypium aridum]